MYINNYNIILILLILFLLFLCYNNINGIIKYLNNTFMSDNKHTLIINEYLNNTLIDDNNNNIIINGYLNTEKSLNIFKHIFKNIKYNINIYSNFDTINKINDNNNNLYIQYSGESYYNDINNYDINFISKKPDNNIILFPYGYFHLLYMNLNINYLINNRLYNNNNKKFCLFVVSNDSCWQRNNFFDKLSKYKKVDSYGNYLNNMDIQLDNGFDTDTFLNKIKEYKFMICFENKSHEYYLTEKLINAYYGETIPIYWGCPQTTEYINTDSILYINPEYDDQQVNNIIDEIILLDNDDNLYQQKYEQSFFKNGQQPDDFNIDKIKEKVELLINNNTQKISNY